MAKMLERSSTTHSLTEHRTFSKKLLEFSLRHILHDHEYRVFLGALGAAAEEPDHVRMCPEHLHHLQFRQQVLLLLFARRLFECFHSNCAGSLDTIDVERLALPSLSEAALTQDPVDL